MKTFLLGITAYGRTGKDTFANIAINILKQKNIKCVKINLADALKESLKDLFSNELNLDVFSNENCVKQKIRPTLVSWGELCRSIDQDYFIKKIKYKCENYLNNNISVIIPDVRFKNECEWINSLDRSFLINLEREGVLPPNNQEKNNIPFIIKEFNIKKYNWPCIKNFEKEYLTSQSLYGIVNEIIEGDLN